MSGLSFRLVWGWRRPALLLLPLAVTFAPGAALAQSFDCAKASSSVEKLICTDPELGALDEALGEIISSGIAAAPARREALLGDERRWLAARDRQCAKDDAAAKDAKPTPSCLISAYRARISVLQHANETAEAGTAVCQSLAEQYRAVAAGDPVLPTGEAFYSTSPLDRLTKMPHGKLALSEPAIRFSGNPGDEIKAWAAKAPQGFALPDDLLKKIADLGEDNLALHHLPGSDYYAASVVAGTGACYSSAYFRATKGGQGREADAPPGWEEASCGVDRLFGTYDKISAAFEESYDQTPTSSSDLTVTPWTKDRFGTPCNITFEFVPRFDAHAAFNDWDQHCTGPACEELRQGALTLVRAVQKDPKGVQKAELARLTPAQQEEFRALVALAGPTPDPDVPPSDETDAAAMLTDKSPLLLPLVQDGKLYLVSAGHFTIGWRVFSDWSVKLETKDGTQLHDEAIFAIGMTKGVLARTTIKKVKASAQ